MTARIGVRPVAPMRSRPGPPGPVPATARMGVLAAAIEAGLSPAPARAHSISVKLLADSSRATFKADAPLEAIVGNTPGDGVTLVLEVSTDLQLETDPTFVRP